MEKYVEIQVESLDEGVIDSLKAPMSKILDFFKKAKINIKEKLSPDKKKIILNAAEVLILFVPVISENLTPKEVVILGKVKDLPLEQSAPVIYKVLKLLAEKDYIEEDEQYFIIRGDMVKRAGIASYVQKSYSKLEKDALIAKIKEADEKKKLLGERINRAQVERERADRVLKVTMKSYIQALKDLSKAQSALAFKTKELKRYQRRNYYQATEIKLRKDELEASFRETKMLVDERDRKIKLLEEELAKYRGEISSCDKVITECGKELLANDLEKDELLRCLNGEQPTYNTEVSEAAVTMAGVALTEVILNFIVKISIILAGYLVADKLISLFRDAIRFNKKLLLEFIRSDGSGVRMGVDNMGESNQEFSEQVIDMEECLVFDESEIDDLFSDEDIDESFIDGAVSKARLLKKIYKLFSTGAIRVTGSKIIIDTEKIGGVENA